VDWWQYGYDGSYQEEHDNDIISNRQKICMHNWKATTLIISVVYDCVKCGVRKEDHDAYYSKYKESK
jgi:hypothetical protein